MPRGRHRQSSALLRISVLAGALAPALIALLLTAIGGSTAVLRVGVLCAVVSTAAVVVLLRQSRRGYGKDLAVRSGERERLAQSAEEARAGREETLLKLAARERELATARERERGMLNRIARLEKALPSRPVRLSAPLFAQGAAALANLERAAAERNRGNLYAAEAPGVGVGATRTPGPTVAGDGVRATPDRRPGQETAAGGGTARKASGAAPPADERSTGVLPRPGAGAVSPTAVRPERAQSAPGPGAAAAAGTMAQANAARTDVVRRGIAPAGPEAAAPLVGPSTAAQNVARPGVSPVDQTAVRRPSATPWAVAPRVSAASTGPVPAAGSADGATAGAGDHSQAAPGTAPTTGSAPPRAAAGRPNTAAERTTGGAATPTAPTSDAATARAAQVPSPSGGQMPAAGATTPDQTAATANSAAASPSSSADGQPTRLGAPRGANGDAPAPTPVPGDPAEPNAQPGDAAAVEPASPQVPGVRRPPIAVSGLVPAYAASVFGPAQGAAPAPAQPVAAPTAAAARPAQTSHPSAAPVPAGSAGDSDAVAGRAGSDFAASTAPAPARRHAAPETPSGDSVPSAPAADERRTPRHAAPAPAAGATGSAVASGPDEARAPNTSPAGTATPALDPAAELVLRPAAAVEAFVPTGETAEAGPVLDLGVESLQPAVAVLPADEAVARVMRDVADTVRETNRRMAAAEAAAGRFDFFGRPAPEEPVAEAPEAEAAPQAPVPPRAARAPRELTAGRAAATRPLLTHEPRTGRALPVDLTAHDDTEQLPKIVDDRKQA